MRILKSFILLTLLLSITETNSFAQISQDSTTSALMNLVSEDNLKTYIDSLSFANGHQTRVTFTDGNRWSTSFIKQIFDDFPGFTSVKYDTFLITNAPPPYNSELVFNVVATLEGKDEPEKIIVLGAHFDCSGSRDINYNVNWQSMKNQGADDNATGVATIFEIARVLTNPENKWNSKYTIQFVAFAAEESHPIYSGSHLGSLDFVKRAYEKTKEIIGVYNVDMIGFNNTGNYHVDIVSNSTSQFLGAEFLKIKSDYMIDLHTNSPPFLYATYSDHERFWAYRFPAILLIENAPPWNNNLPWYVANPYYHTQGDSLGTVNLSQVKKVTETLLGTVVSLSMQTTKVKHHEILSNVPPKNHELYQNFPNPFNLATSIKYKIYRQTHVQINIFNHKGQNIITLIDQVHLSGDYQLDWNGTDHFGREVASGIYILSLSTNDSQTYRKLILNK